MTRRRIDTGHGVITSHRTPVEIAERRPTGDPKLFLETFARVRTIAASLPDLDTLWTILGDRHTSPVMEAAAIEALASLRAAGIRM